MNEDYIKLLIRTITDIPTIKPLQIPDIELYMDQVTTFAEDKLKYYKRTDEDKILTKTMINNYTKATLISPPIKKKYSKNHMLTLIMIYHLKNILSINDISKLLSNMNSENTEDIYCEFIKIQENENNKLTNELSDQLKSINTEISKQNDENISDDKTDALLAVLILITQAEARKQLAEKIIDDFFGKIENKETKKENNSKEDQ